MGVYSVNQNHLKAACNNTKLYFFSKLSTENRRVQWKEASVNYRFKLFSPCYYLSSLIFEENLHCISHNTKMVIKSIKDNYAAYIYGQEGVRNLVLHLTGKQI